MNRHVNLPFTEEGKKLNMTNELFEVCKVVYQKVPSNNDETSDNTANDYRFKSLYNPDIDYGDDCIIVPFQSVFLDIDYWKKGTIFCNVIGSSDDKGHDENNKKMSWHKLCDTNNIAWHCHAEEGKFYRSSDNHIFNKFDDSKYTCINSIIGGHVIKDETTPQELVIGDNVYIIPICKHHNSVAVPDENGQTYGNGSGFYMKMRDDSYVLVMSGYLEKIKKDW